MSETGLKLKNPPIVEAVVDIDCDLSTGFDLRAFEAAARDAFGNSYPKPRKQFLHQHQFRIEGPESAKVEASHGLQALQFLTDDERQLVQVRVNGFSFNRLAPYSTLDDYLPEIERTWRLFVELVKPLQIRRIALRYINRILLPVTGDSLKLEDYLKISPRLPDEENMLFVSFLRHHVAIEKSTGNLAIIILTTQPPTGQSRESVRLPIIFDNMARRDESLEPPDWDKILDRIGSLRSLKNRVFQNTLTDKCLELFQR